MKATTNFRSFHKDVAHLLTAQVWKQAHQAWTQPPKAVRWTLQPLIWTLLAFSFCLGGSEGERFATARAYCVARLPKKRRPGETLQGFQSALDKLPMHVLRGLRLQLAASFLDGARIGGFVPLGCDGSRLECPRAQELQERLGQSGKPDSAPMAYLSALVLLPLGIPWSWWWGKGTASEHTHLRKLLPTLPERALLVADALYQGYDLYAAIVKAGASFLERLSSRCHLYTDQQVALERFREGLVYYWPQAARDQGKPPLRVRVVRVNGNKGADVWLLTNVLERKELSRTTAAQLYRWRWRNELAIRALKVTLGMDELRCKFPEMVRREIWACLLAYNLIRQTPLEAAAKAKLSPRQLSFTAAVQKTAAAWLVMAVCQDEALLLLLIETMLGDMAKNQVGDRPDRVEPRKVKRRPKPHPRLTEPRDQARAKLYETNAA